MRRVVTMVLAMLALGVVGVSPTAGQDASPAATSACTVEPYDLTEVLANAAASPVAATPEAASPEAATGGERPTGQPADEATVAGVTETVEQFLACVNAGYQLRILFLFTPEYLTESLVGTGAMTAEVRDQLADEIANETELAPLPEAEQTVLIGIEDVEILDDGRVVATVIADDRTSDAPESPVYFIFEEVDGVYLIDGVIDPVNEEGTPVA